MYLDIKEKEKRAINDNNIFAFSMARSLINDVMKQFKYGFNDLTKDELFVLHEMNGLCNDQSNLQLFYGSYVLGVVGNIETKRLELKKLYEYDVFKIYNQIDQIIKNRIPELTLNYE